MLKVLLATSSLVALAIMSAGCATSSSANEDELTEQDQASLVVAAAGDKVLSFQYQIQQTGYWCGPAATRAVLSARMSNPPSQQQLANQLPTDQDGTDWIGQVTRTLNRNLGGSPSWYQTREMTHDPPTASEEAQLWKDLVYNIDRGYGVVANIVAPPNNHPPGYPNYTVYHYFAVMGYNATTKKVYIADSANFGGYQKYWLTFRQLATLIPPKGYSAKFAAPEGPPTTRPLAPEGCGTIPVGRGLGQGDAFSSCDERFTLKMQPDGNLVLYKNAGAAALWSSNTFGSDGFAAVMQPDGNFVLYGKQTNALWASGTNGHANASLTIQNDGNVVVYDGANALWATGTNQ